MGLSSARVEAAVAVSDLAAARRFYDEQLQLAPIEEEEQGVRYRCAGNSGIFVYLAPDNAGRSPATLAGFFVDDLDATMADLASRGLDFERYDQPGLKTDDRGAFHGPGFRACWVKDPDGNTLAITQTGG